MEQFINCTLIKERTLIVSLDDILPECHLNRETSSILTPLDCFTFERCPHRMKGCVTKFAERCGKLFNGFSKLKMILFYWKEDDKLKVFAVYEKERNHKFLPRVNKFSFDYIKTLGETILLKPSVSFWG